MLKVLSRLRRKRWLVVYLITKENYITIGNYTCEFVGEFDEERCKVIRKEIKEQIKEQIKELEGFNEVSILNIIKLGKVSGQEYGTWFNR